MNKPRIFIKTTKLMGKVWIVQIPICGFVYNHLVSHFPTEKDFSRMLHDSKIQYAFDTGEMLS